ncbi:MAG TPA: hypothetical protein VGN90_09110 [Pyrinomonadaceae bacterium]|jgi:hypothetical protein|nr:hypothetical protein [Pyrinomonadaceae bacterium]
MTAQSTKTSVLKAAFVRFVAGAILLLALFSASVAVTAARGDDFGEVVRLIERFYHVKHSGIPFLARAGIKTATTVARIAGGPKRQLAEAGSVKVVYFEDQDFNASDSFVRFKSSMNAALLQSWSPLIQVASPKAEEQTYIYLRNAGDKFNVLVVTIEAREACVVQVTLKPETLAKLLQSPDSMGNEITIDATKDEN